MRGESGRVAARVRELLRTENADDVGLDSGGRGGPVERTAMGGAQPPDEAVSRSRWGLLRRRAEGRWRLDPGRRGAIAVGVGVLVAAVATGAWVMVDRPQPVAMSRVASAPMSAVVSAAPSAGTSAARPVTSSAAAAAPLSGAAPSSAGEVVVDVAGKVRRPGLYRLPTGARVDDAVRAAGGALVGVNLASLNLAAKVVDGQQISVGVAAATPAGAPVGDTASAGGTPDSASSGPVNLNTATPEELQTLPGVGPVLAQHILDWRTAHGRFESVDRLNDVPGIGEVKFAALRSRVTV